jgi:predicted Rossmann fold nucleotide-binding protein DprA/Smf involved in DNA uptake
VAAQLAESVAAEGVTAVNGGGYGVDEAALRATICAHGRTVVVLPCGVDQIYRLATPGCSMMSSGAVVFSSASARREPWPAHGSPVAPGCSPRSVQ